MQEEASDDEEQRALARIIWRRAQPRVDHARDVFRGELVHGPDPARTEERGLTGNACERGIPIGELGERIAVRAPRSVPEVGEVMEVAERLERLGTFRSALRELDRTLREVLALLDREAAVRVRRSRQKLRARLPAQIVVVQVRERRVVVVREQFRELAVPSPLVRSIQAAVSACARPRSFRGRLS